MGSHPKTILFPRSLVFATIVWTCLIAVTRQQGAGCQYKADVMFVFDASDSMTAKNFKDEVAFIRDTVRGFYLHPQTGFMVGAIAFSSRLQQVPIFPFRNYNGFIAGLNNIKHDQDSSLTHIALQTMRYQYQIYGRRGVPRIAVVLTDGRSKDGFQTVREANMAKSMGITIMTIGVGVDLNLDELSRIASSSQLAFTSLNQNSVRRISYTIASILCSTITVPTGFTDPTTKTTRHANTTRIKHDSTTSSEGMETTTRAMDSSTHVSDSTKDPGTPTTHSPKDPCAACIYTNGVGYVRHPRCDRYYQCFLKDGMHSHIVMSCARDQFWDQKTLTCRPPSQVVCPTDPCNNRALQHYAHPDNCAMYWKCYNGRTDQFVCCQKGYGYIPGISGCTVTLFCRDTCQSVVVPTREAECNLMPDLINPSRYFSYIFGMRFPMKCAAGTAFSRSTCSCSLHVRQNTVPDKDECKPEVYLPFNNDTKDKSGNEMWILTEGDVTVRDIPGAVGGGAAFFHERNRVILSRFSNDDFRHSLVIKFRYREIPHIGQMGGLESIVSNSDCGRDCSVDISLDRWASKTVGKLKTYDSGTKKLAVIHSQVWRNVEYKYDGKRFTLSVNGVTREIPATGNIVPVQAALQLGHGCERSRPFIGYIDEFYVYKCIP